MSDNLMDELCDSLREVIRIRDRRIAELEAAMAGMLTIRVTADEHDEIKSVADVLGVSIEKFTKKAIDGAVADVRQQKAKWLAAKYDLTQKEALKAIECS